MITAHRITISCVSVLLAGASPTQAQSEGRRERPTIPLIKALDLNGDGSLSTVEMAKATASL